MYRLEIVTAKAGPEPIVWNFFPRLVPTAFSESFCIYACSADEALSQMQISLLDGWIEEAFIVAYNLSENDQPILHSHVTPVEAEELSGYSEEYWRQQAWLGKVPGAMKQGKQWLLPRSMVESRKKPSH